MPFTQSTLYVVDTNVWLVAQAGANVDEECHLEALRFLDLLDDGETCIAVDDQHLIFGEYFGLLSQQLASFHLLTDLIRQERVLQRQIDVSEGAAVLPNALERLVHDRSDRKFVAVSLSFASIPPVVNASDRDWVDWEDGLGDYGIEVIQLCPEVVHAPRSPAERPA